MPVFSKTGITVQSHSVRIYTPEFLKELKEIGVSQAILRVYENGGSQGGFHFKNSQFKTISQELEKTLKASDKYGIKLTAWMITRNYKWIRDKSLLDVSFDKESKYINKIDVFNKEATARVKATYRDLVATGVESVMLQDDAVIKRTEGFSEHGKNAFFEMTGHPPVEKLMQDRNHFYFQNWIRVKINRINSLISNVVKTCRSNAPGKMEVGMNIYYETPVFTNNSEKWYSHNLSELLLTGIDKVYLMAYHRQIKNEMKYSESKNLVFFKSMIDRAYSKADKKLVVKMQIRDWKTGDRIPVREMKRYIDRIDKKIERICFTPIKKEDLEYLSELAEYIKGRSR